MKHVLDGELEETSNDMINVMFGAEDHVDSNQTDEHNFWQSRKKEITCLLEAGIFEIVDRKDVPKGTRIYGSRWVDTLKRGRDGQGVEKSRLIAHNYRDYRSRHIPTEAPTISKIGQGLALIIVAMKTDGNAFVRDVTQAYVQSKSELDEKF